MGPVNQFELIAGGDRPAFNDAEVPTAETGLSDGGENFVLTQMRRQFETRLPRLRNLAQRRADLPAVADADVVFGETGDGAIFAEGSRSQRLPIPPLPKREVVTAVAQNRFIDTAVDPPIGLLVADKALRSNLLSAGDWLLGDRRLDDARDFTSRIDHR